MLALTALESHLNKCVIVGESIGNVPEGFMEKLKEKRFETEGSVPLLVYVNYKLCEMKNVRVVMALKRCRADKDKIIARLVDCYAG